MFSLFGSRLPIDQDELEFQLAGFKWLAGEFGEVAEAPLILPTPDFFPSRGRKGVEALFEEVREAAGLSNWPCALEAGGSDRETIIGIGNQLVHDGPNAPCGTFRIEEGPNGQQGIISYNPDMERDTEGLVATFAHELGHYLMATATSAPPGGWSLHELHTDLAAVYLGFGIFLANSARNFSQYQISATGGGWISSRQGYLSEGALVTALAIFQRLAGRDPMDAAIHLKPYLKSDLKRAARGLAKAHPDMRRAVAAIDLGLFVRD